MTIDGLNDGTNSLSILKPSGPGELSFYKMAFQIIQSLELPLRHMGVQVVPIIIVLIATSGAVNTNNTISYCNLSLPSNQWDIYGLTLSGAV